MMSRTRTLLPVNELSFGDSLQVRAIGRLAVKLRRFKKFLARDPTVDISYFLHGGDLHALRPLDDAHEFRSLRQCFYGARVQPGVTAPERDDLELVFFKIEPVEVGDLQFARGEGFTSFASSQTCAS